MHLAKTIPERFVAKSGGSNRVGRIFVDYLRNGARQTTAAAFSARSRPGLGVSMPVAWEQLMALKGGAQWTVATAREYLSFEQKDPWADYWTTRPDHRPRHEDARPQAVGPAQRRRVTRHGACPYAPGPLAQRGGPETPVRARRRMDPKASRSPDGRPLDRIALALVRPRVDPRQAVLGDRELGVAFASTCSTRTARA